MRNDNLYHENFMVTLCQFSNVAWKSIGTGTIRNAAHTKQVRALALLVKV